MLARERGEKKEKKEKEEEEEDAGKMNEIESCTNKQRQVTSCHFGTIFTVRGTVKSQRGRKKKKKRTTTKRKNIRRRKTEETSAAKVCV